MNRIAGTDHLTPEQHREEVDSIHADIMGQKLDKPITLTFWCHDFLAQAFLYADKETSAKIEQIRARCEKVRR